MSANDLTRRGMLVGTLAMTGSCRWLMGQHGNGGGGEGGPAKIGVYTKRTLDTGLRDRPYYLHVPKQQKGKSSGLPIVFAFHGHGGRGEVLARMACAQCLADRSALVVMPTAIKGDWTMDDIDFIRGIADELKAQYGAQKKIWAMGFSDGGAMAIQLGYKTDWTLGIGTTGITLPKVMEDRITRLPLTVQVIGEKDEHYTGADPDTIPWEPARAVVCGKVGAQNSPQGPRNIGSGPKTSAERFDFPGNPPYVWIRVKGATSTHRIYDKAEGDGINDWDAMIDVFRENGLKMG